MTLGEFRNQTRNLEDDVELKAAYLEGSESPPRIDDAYILEGCFYAQDLRTGADAVYVLY